MDEIPNGYYRDADGMLQQKQAALEARTEVSFIPDMDDAKLRKLTREKLSMALQAIDPLVHPEMTRKLCAEVMDRIDGKPGQAITMSANLNVVTVNANIEFIPAERDKVIDGVVDNLQVIDSK